MSEFRVSTCLIGIGETGGRRVRRGVEARGSDREMVPDEGVSPAAAVVADGEDVAELGLSSFDVVAVTGEFTERGAVETAVRVEDACESDASTVAVFSGEPQDADVEQLRRCFGTVVMADRNEIIREFITDVLTLFSQPMMLEADYRRLASNLDGGSVGSLHRAVGDRDQLEKIVEQASGSGETLFGYVEVGSEFTLRDAERLEALLPDSDVVTGQATLRGESGCRLTLLREE